MKIELDTENTASNKIISYSDDGFKLKDKFVNSNLVISKDQIIENWLEEGFINLAAHHVDTFIDKRPEIILLGTGKQQLFPKLELMSYITSKNIGFEVMDTGAACRSYNLLVDEGRDVIACLILAAN